MKRLALVLFILPLAAPVQAQTTPAASYQLKVFAPGVSPTSGTSMQTIALPPAAFACNRDPQIPVTSTVTPVPNPKVIEWDDLANPGKACSATVDVSPLPVALGYQMVLVALDAQGEVSDQSNAVPFDRRGKPATPTHLRGK